MVTQQKAKASRKGTWVNIRLPEEKATMLQLIANTETAGNRSEFVRALIDREIAERSRRARR